MFQEQSNERNFLGEEGAILAKAHYGVETAFLKKWLDKESTEIKLLISSGDTNSFSFGPLRFFLDSSVFPKVDYFSFFV